MTMCHDDGEIDGAVDNAKDNNVTGDATGFGWIGVLGRGQRAASL